VGALQCVINATIDYTKQREAFGLALIDNQSVHFRLAELQTELECLRALVYSTCERYINGENPNNLLQLASMCKLKAGRLGRELTDACLQYWGGMGYMWDNMVSRSYRDSRLASIGGGADEVMLGIICKTMNILPSKKKG
jgi:citronellyl-CoA dehydrogenase